MSEGQTVAPIPFQLAHTDRCCQCIACTSAAFAAITDGVVSNNGHFFREGKKKASDKQLQHVTSPDGVQQELLKTIIIHLSITACTLHVCRCKLCSDYFRHGVIVGRAREALLLAEQSIIYWCQHEIKKIENINLTGRLQGNGFIRPDSDCSCRSRSQ